LPELPDARRERLTAQYGLPLYDASLLTASKATADFFEECLRLRSPQGGVLRASKGEAPKARAKALSNWLLGDVARLLHAQDRELASRTAGLKPAHLVELVELIEEGTLSSSLAKTVLEEVLQTGKTPVQIVEEKGYTQISDAQAVAEAVAQAVDANPQAVADYLGGKETALRFLVGQVMKLTRGQANPAMVNQALKERLKR
ncbi:MAG: Asp-tRNA(Asn)/Glu-tRNA(Gln) amidotransferase GatCAB subunit B, partial [Dehalococcoidia bacterium]